MSHTSKSCCIKKSRLLSWWKSTEEHLLIVRQIIYSGSLHQMLCLLCGFYCFFVWFFLAQFILDCILFSSWKRHEPTYFLCRNKTQPDRPTDQPTPTTDILLHLSVWSIMIPCDILCHYVLTGKIIQISELRKDQLKPCYWFSISHRTVEKFYRVGRQLMLQYLKMLTDAT